MKNNSLYNLMLRQRSVVYSLVQSQEHLRSIFVMLQMFILKF